MIAAVLTAATAGLLLAPASAAHARNNQHRSHSSPRHAVAPPPARIACTVLGCQPIPGACTPVPGRTLSGLPTGYDVVVCPPGVSPLR
jgi:hypothetical protein